MTGDFCFERRRENLFLYGVVIFKLMSSLRPISPKALQKKRSDYNIK